MVPSVHRRGVSRLLLVVVALAGLSQTLTAQVRSINLAEMARSAGVAFIGTVADVRSGLDEDREIVTWTTFRVEQPIGFLPVPMITVKQLGGTADGVSHHLSHMRYFQPGERVLVMFYPTSELGFTSPIGLDQAVWTVTNDGRVVGVRQSALDGMGGALARHGIAPRASQDVPLVPFVSLLEELIAQGRIIR